MKDVLGWNRWWNRELANPTQNAYYRFQKSPLTGLPDYFGDVMDRWGLAENKLLKTRYGDILEGGVI